MMPLHFDWKFALTLVATLAGVLIPVWLWQADQSSKSIALRVVSTTELRPEGTAKLDGVQLSIDGKPIERPFLSVIELESTGTRPTQSSDFDSPIDILAKRPTVLLKAQVTRVVPEDLKPALVVGAEKLTLSPLLLNPGDQVQVTILTSGPWPEFAARSRIAGISSLTVENFDLSRMKRREWARLTTATLLLVLYMNLMADVFFAVRRRVFKPWHLAAALTACMGSVLLLKVPGSAGSQLSSTEWTVFAVASGMSLVLLLFRLPLRRSAA